MPEEKNTVLFVDDEAHILSSIRRATMDEAFEALFAGSGQEALDIFEKREISVIVTDMRMPGMDGLALLKVVKEKYPKTVRIVLSGYTQLSQVLVTVNQADIFQFIPKPWNMEEELLAGVRQGIKQFNLAIERDRLQGRLQQKNQAYQNIFRELEQKFSNEKRDLSNLKKIHHWIFTFWKKNLDMEAKFSAENKIVFGEYIDLIEIIVEKYLDILPTNVSEKSTLFIIDELNKVSSDQVIIQAEHNHDAKFYGYHVFFIMMFKSLLDIFDFSEEKTVCTINWDKDSSNRDLLVITLELPQKSKFAILAQNRVKMACSLLNEMGKAYNVWIKQELVEGKVNTVQIIEQSIDKKG